MNVSFKRWVLSDNKSGLQCRMVHLPDQYFSIDKVLVVITLNVLDIICYQRHDTL